MFVNAPTRYLCLVAVAALSLAACPKDDDGGAGGGGAEPGSSRPLPKPPAKKDPAVADIRYTPAPADPAATPKKPKSPPAEASVRYLLVRYLGLAGAAGISRSKAEAARRAELLAKIARQKGADFKALIASYSDVAKADHDKIYRVAPDSKLPYAEAAFGMEVGQVAGPVPSGRGFYVVKRVEPEEISTAHILIMYKGAKLAPVAFKRKKEDAEKLAKKLLEKALKPDANFALLASRYSDSPSKSRGGVIAPLIKGKLLEGFQPYFDAASKTEPGAVYGEVVETPYGYHVLRRLKLQKILVRHVLIAYTGSDGKPKERRTKQAAKLQAIRLRAKLVAGKKDFAEAAREISEDRGSADLGGKLPPFTRGEMVPRFEQFAFGLKVGQISSVVETRYGFHIIKRLR